MGQSTASQGDKGKQSPAEKQAEKREAENKAALQKTADEQKAADEKAAADVKAQEEAGKATAGANRPTSTAAAAGRAATPGDTQPDEKGLTYAGENPQGGVSGPGTGALAPPESTYRMPASMIGDPEDNPLAPPSDHKRQTDPPQGFNESSTDHVYAAAGGRTIAGEDFSAFVDEDGKRLRPSSLFDESDTMKTYVFAKVRAYEEFYYPNTTEVARRLVLVPGQKIPRGQAEQMKAAISDAPTPLAEV